MDILCMNFWFWEVPVLVFCHLKSALKKSYFLKGFEVIFMFFWQCNINSLLMEEIYFCLSKSLIQSVGSLLPFINQLIELILRSMLALLKIFQLPKFPSSDYLFIQCLQRGNFHIQVSPNDFHFDLHDLHDYIILEIVERFSLSMKFSFLLLHCFYITLQALLKNSVFIELSKR